MFMQVSPKKLFLPHKGKKGGEIGHTLVWMEVLKSCATCAANKIIHEITTL